MTEKTKNIFEKVMTARLEFLQSNPTKSGYNKFQNFKYFELVDIVPVATNICCKLGLYTHINITDGKAVMTVVNMENSIEKLEFKIDAPMVRENDFNKMLQDVGRAETYIRRYLYMLFLDIVENDLVDGADQKSNDFKTAKQYKSKPKTRQKKEKNFQNANNIITEKSAARVTAENIIRGLKNPTILAAKMELAEIRKDMSKEECMQVLKELEVLLNAE